MISTKTYGFFLNNNPQLNICRNYNYKNYLKIKTPTQKQNNHHKQLLFSTKRIKTDNINIPNLGRDGKYTLALIMNFRVFVVVK